MALAKCEFFSPVEPPPPELPWKEQPGHVLHLSAENFKSDLKKKKSSLVMFYAPCKQLHEERRKLEIFCILYLIFRVWAL